MSRTEVQREVRVTAAVITQRPAQRAVPGPDGGLQMGPLVGAQPHRIGLVPVAPLGLAPGQLTQEALATRLTRAAAAPLVPGQERSMGWGRRGKVTPRSRITGHLRHAYDTTFAGGHPAPAPVSRVPPAGAAGAVRRGPRAGPAPHHSPRIRGLAWIVPLCPACGMALKAIVAAGKSRILLPGTYHLMPEMIVMITRWPGNGRGSLRRRRGASRPSGPAREEA